MDKKGKGMKRNAKHLIFGLALLAGSMLAMAEDAIPKHLELAREFLMNTKPENNEHYAQGVRSLLRPSDKGSGNPP
jgi:hypothetical protein